MSKGLPVKKESWEIVIAPRSKVFALDLGSVWRYRDLIFMFFKRDFVTTYKQTILGPLWYIIQPIATALTYYVIFGKIANLSSDGLPPLLFYMSGIILWTYFSFCLTSNSEVFSKNSSLFSKVYFPRLVVPISVIMSGMVALGIQFFLLAALTLTSWLNDNSLVFHLQGILFIPLIVLHIALLGLGVGLIVSAMTVRFRDLVFAVGFFTQLWMYGTPVVYPYSQIPVKYQWFFHFNPMTAPIETLRSVLFGTQGVPASVWMANLGITLFLLFLGTLVFTRAESSAMDTV